MRQIISFYLFLCLHKVDHCLSSLSTERSEVRFSPCNVSHMSTSAGQMVAITGGFEPRLSASKHSVKRCQRDMNNCEKNQRDLKLSRK